jgi:hypothetical protein
MRSAAPWKRAASAGSRKVTSFGYQRSFTADTASCRSSLENRDPDAPTIDDPAGLRVRLIAMRAELVERLACDGIEGGTLALLAGINAAIEACDLAAERPADMVANGRAVLSDDGAAITLTLYTRADPVAAVALAPHRAVALAGELIAAALRRLRVP